VKNQKSIWQNLFCTCCAGNILNRKYLCTFVNILISHYYSAFEVCRPLLHIYSIGHTRTLFDYLCKVVPWVIHSEIMRGVPGQLVFLMADLFRIRIHSDHHTICLPISGSESRWYILLVFSNIWIRFWILTHMRSTFRSSLDPKPD
jgi:hypothetical protein